MDPDVTQQWTTEGRLSSNQPGYLEHRPDLTEWARGSPTRCRSGSEREVVRDTSSHVGSPTCLNDRKNASERPDISRSPAPAAVGRRCTRIHAQSWYWCSGGSQRREDRSWLTRSIGWDLRWFLSRKIDPLRGSSIERVHRSDYRTR